MVIRLTASACFALVAVIACFAVGEPAGVSWPKPTPTMKPWVYNWWMGSAVDEAGLEHQSRELTEKGFGGFALIEYERDYENNAMGLAESLGYYRGVIDALKLPLRT